MVRVRKTVKARRDALDIWHFIASDDEAAANRTVQEIEARAALYAENPLLGQRRPTLGNDVRSFPIRRYVVFYRPIAGGIEILRILHGARDIPSEFEA